MLTLPDRAGAPPVTGLTPPQLQYTEQSPDPVYEALLTWAFTAYPGVRREASLISVRGAHALWLDERIPAPAHVFMPPRGSREYAHTHPCGSMHLLLAEDDETRILESGWGLRHPAFSQGFREMLIYAPRDFEELEITKKILDASYGFATGHAATLSDCTCTQAEGACPVHGAPAAGGEVDR